MDELYDMETEEISALQDEANLEDEPEAEETVNLLTTTSKKANMVHVQYYSLHLRQIPYIYSLSTLDENIRTEPKFVVF